MNAFFLYLCRAREWTRRWSLPSNTILISNKHKDPSMAPTFSLPWPTTTVREEALNRRHWVHPMAWSVQLLDAVKARRHHTPKRFLCRPSSHRQPALLNHRLSLHSPRQHQYLDPRRKEHRPGVAASDLWRMRWWSRRYSFPLCSSMEPWMASVLELDLFCVYLSDMLIFIWRSTGKYLSFSTANRQRRYSLLLNVGVCKGIRIAKYWHPLLICLHRSSHQIQEQQGFIHDPLLWNTLQVRESGTGQGWCFILHSGYVADIDILTCHHFFIINC